MVPELEEESSVVKLNQKLYDGWGNDERVGGLFTCLSDSYQL